MHSEPQPMPDYHTQNLKKEYYEDLKEFLEDHPRYNGVKDFMKQAANEKREEIEKRELEKQKLDN